MNHYSIRRINKYIDLIEERDANKKLNEINKTLDNIHKNFENTKYFFYSVLFCSSVLFCLSVLLFCNF